jgi:hypothetical protein
MADSSKAGNGDSNSWPGLLAYLNKTFDLLRDIFGYMLPGLVFFAIGVASGHFSMQATHDKMFPLLPGQIGLALLAGAGCYAMGHILIMLAYLPMDVIKLGVGIGAAWCDWRGNANAEKKAEAEKRAEWLRSELQSFPTEVTAESVKARRRHPDFFLVYERRETMAMAEAGLGMALLLGGVYFYFLWSRWSFRSALVTAGMLLLFDFATGILHLQRVRAALLLADKEIGTELDPGEYERAILDMLKQCVQPPKDCKKSANKDGEAADGPGSEPSPGLIQAVIDLLRRRS